MAVNGDFIQGYGAGKSAGMSQKIAEAAAEWLDENVDPETGYVLDSSLTVANAAADAKAVGVILSDLKNITGQIGNAAYLEYEIVESGEDEEQPTETGDTP